MDGTLLYRFKKIAFLFLMICNHNNFKKIFFYGNTPICKCYECQLIFQKNKKKPVNTKNLYSQYYKNEISSRFHFGLEYIVRIFRFFRAFKLFTIRSKAKTILDIGSGRGFTLYYLKKYYKYNKVVGTQLCQNAVDFSRNKLGLEIYDKDLLKINFKNEKFDIITMWHVLEHVTRPEEYVRKIHGLLAPKGIFLIEVPNFNSWTSKITGKYWLGLDLKYHLSFFTKDSLTALLKKYKFKIIDVHTFSLEYSTFISTQSLISKITNTDQLFFEWLQTKQKDPRFIIHFLLFAFFAPPCLIINLFMYYSDFGETLLITAEKSR